MRHHRDHRPSRVHQPECRRLTRSCLRDLPAYLDLAIVSVDEWAGDTSGAQLRPFQETVPSSFSAKPTSTHGVLRRELDHLKAEDRTLYVAIAAGHFRRDGRPRADAVVTAPGVVLSFLSGDRRYEYVADRLRTQHENLRAIALTLEHLRAVDRYGLTGNRQQYDGFAAIEAPRASAPQGFSSVASVREWLLDLAGLEPSSGARNALLIRRAKRDTHPDHGGDTIAFQRVLDAEKYLKQNGAL